MGVASLFGSVVLSDAILKIVPIVVETSSTFVGTPLHFPIHPDAEDVLPALVRVCPLTASSRRSVPNGYPTLLGAARARFPSCLPARLRAAQARPPNSSRRRARHVEGSCSPFIVSQRWLKLECRLVFLVRDNAVGEGRRQRYRFRATDNGSRMQTADVRGRISRI